MHHPDKNGDQEKFKKISSTYEVLGDVEKGRKYDNNLSPSSSSEDEDEDEDEGSDDY